MVVKLLVTELGRTPSQYLPSNELLTESPKCKHEKGTRLISVPFISIWNQSLDILTSIMVTVSILLSVVPSQFIHSPLVIC